MGWIWSSSSTSPQSSKSSTSNPAVTPSIPEPPASSPALPEPLPATSQRPPTRDEIAESELRSFLEELEADARPSSTKYNRVPHPPPPHGNHAGPANLTLEEDLLPTNMSCRQAFDAAFYCQSLGGQFNNLYRYGGIRSCSQNWKDFWFCMRTKSYTPELKAVVVRDHYKRRALKYKVGPSSEDIWESREERLEWGEAFNEPVDMPAGSDEEWNRLEQMRREGRAEGTT